MDHRTHGAVARPGYPIETSRYDAAIFDLDGVITDTATVHAAAWSRVFDELLHRRSREGGQAFVPFSADEYGAMVDGRPRLDAIRTVLAARGIQLPEGRPDGSPDANTIHGIGARKNRAFLDAIRHDGVESYPSSVALIRRLRSEGIRTAVVSASRNCLEVLRAAGLHELFDAIVDGDDRLALGLPGKPAPDTFLEAARRLGVAPSRALVVEDAVAGVRAAHAGGFALIVGVDRSGATEDLRAVGADVVVHDLALLEVDGDRPPPTPDCMHRAPDPWCLVYEGYDPALETRRETLLALGNGYFVTRGACSEVRADEFHYPGTYLAGGYNRLTSIIDGRSVEHEDLANLPNWLPLSFRIDGGEWLDLHACTLLECRRTLDLARGLYQRSVHLRDSLGRETRFEERRLVHMGDPHLAAQHVAITAVNWAGQLTVRAAIDGGIVNSGALRYRDFDGRHVQVRETTAPDAETVLLDSVLVQSRLGVAIAARIRASASGGAGQITRTPFTEEVQAGHELSLTVGTGSRVDVEKIVALHSTRDRAATDPVTEARTAAARAGNFDDLLESHVLAWAQLWKRFDVDAVEVHADPAHDTHLNVRLHVFHLLQTASPHTIDLDAGIPARGWHGEGYRGHVFWDELFIFPFLVTRSPLLARELLLYRHRRLPEARWAARAAGYRGAMFPWQSGSNGREETDVMYLNPRSGRWILDHTHLQRHVGSAVAYNVWQHYEATGDSEFLFVYGAELLLEIARFWSSTARWNEARGRYDIRGVLGPDEFHDRLPGSDTPGLTNNTYTNVMAAWCLARALDVLALLPDERCRELCEELALSSEEIVHWDEVSRKLYLPFVDGGVPSQFEGYDHLEEFDWTAYRRRYPDIRRLDLILESEGRDPNRYRISKQADVLMLFYLFSAEELAQLFERLGYAFDGSMIPRTIAYYLERTSHGSTLSGIVHAWVLARSTRVHSWPVFLEALRSDVDDIQGGTTAEGVHLGAMAGSVDLLQRCYTGMELRGGELRFHPLLPEELKRLSFTLRYRGHSLSIEVTSNRLQVGSAPGAAEPIFVVVDGQRSVLRPGAERAFPLGGVRPARAGSPARLSLEA